MNPLPESHSCWNASSSTRLWSLSSLYTPCQPGLINFTLLPNSMSHTATMSPDKITLQVYTVLQKLNTRTSHKIYLKESSASLYSLLCKKEWMIHALHCRPLKCFWFKCLLLSSDCAVTETWVPSEAQITLGNLIIEWKPLLSFSHTIWESVLIPLLLRYPTLLPNTKKVYLQMKGRNKSDQSTNDRAIVFHSFMLSFILTIKYDYASRSSKHIF